MQATAAAPSRRDLARLDAGIILLIVVLGLVSVVVWSRSAFPGVEDARALDIAINVAATMVGAAVAIHTPVATISAVPPITAVSSRRFIWLLHHVERVSSATGNHGAFNAALCLAARWP